MSSPPPSSMPPPPPPGDVYHDWAPYVSVFLICLANFLCYFCNDNGLFGRWLWKRHGRSAFFASNTRGGRGWKHSLPNTFWAFDALDPKSVVTSWFLGDWGVLVVHVLTLTWLMVCLIVEATKNGPVNGEWVTYFTHWSLVLLSFAGGVAMLNHIRYMWRRTKAGLSLSRVSPEPSLVNVNVTTAVGAEELGEAGGGVHPKHMADAAAAAAAGKAHNAADDAATWDWLSCFSQLTMQTAVNAAFFLDVYYWVVLIAIQGDPVEGPATQLKHGGNLGIAALEVFLTRMPIVSVHFQATLAYGTAYLVFLWIYGSVSGTWRYSLNWKKTSTVIMHAAVPIALAVFMLIWWGLAMLRDVMGAAFNRWRTRRRHPAPSAMRDPGAAALQG
ncbi:hypothetical protein HYH02_014493 [Chlamydomonas schloesseri]|uniref:Uncharacterized protein n=1 Tax=Chlamydomonas schloesseri TaxID=2026947 RepID=A0A835SW42_9CHLO|nr:hypothetical protein HYH02_014493 [Chlamydomonas schloesseri]|eukprot:KAG2427890.1 hypothetical protein HYH02_014493 [Chlamydomonas schloesseri]